MKCKKKFNCGQWYAGCGKNVNDYIEIKTTVEHIEHYNGNKTVIKKEIHSEEKCFDCYVGNDDLIISANPINEQGKEKIDNRVCKDNYWLKKNPPWLNGKKWKEYIPKCKINEKTKKY